MGLSPRRLTRGRRGRGRRGACLAAEAALLRVAGGADGGAEAVAAAVAELRAGTGEMVSQRKTANVCVCVCVCVLFQGIQNIPKPWGNGCVVVCLEGIPWFKEETKGKSGH